jgi:hypothetical protein
VSTLVLLPSFTLPCTIPLQPTYPDRKLINGTDWSDPRTATDKSLLDRFLAPDNPQAPTSIYVTLTPPISTTSTLTKNPVTELCSLPFASTISALEQRQLDTDLINFRAALMEQLPQSTGPCSWAMGYIDRPTKLVHANSPSGHAVVHFLTVGWDSVEAHMKAKESTKFSESMAPLRKKMLAPIPGLEMKHVSFQHI